MRVWGDPYEHNGVLLYPSTMTNCESFYECVQVLMYEKNKIQDIQIIKTDYLTFLFALIQQDISVFHRLDKLIKLVLQDQEYQFEVNDSGTIILIINGIIFNGYEFDILRKIILDINGIRLEEILDSEMGEEMRKLEEYNNRESGTPATLEERVITLHCLSHIPYQELKKYTIFQFTKTLERFSIIKNFEVYSALLAENGSSKDIVHFLAHIEEKGRFENLAMSKEKFNEISSIGNNGVTV